MAVYTDVSENEVTAFLADYGLGKLLSYKGIAEGVENSNFLLRAEGGTYILTLYEKRVDRNDLPFFIGLMEHLAAEGLSCPLPVKNSHGLALGELAGRPAALFTFLEGMWTRRPTAGQAWQVGEALAGMHLKGQDFALQRPNALSVAAWRPLYEGCGPRTAEVEAGLSAEIESELAFLEANWPSNLPTGVIHADLFNDNVFFLQGELSGLIDFYFACNDILVYDLAICLGAWCFEQDGAFNITKGRAMLEGYNSVRSLSVEELEALPILCRGASMRFMLTRLYDWIHIPDTSFVTKKDPKEYLQKSRFHRQVRSVADYGFTSQLLNQ
ncbi:homoserine kinase [Aureimonas fodinaquatilis]|uniref:Homoserine kinase n=1 Tax=Aureimonas fodinaquatilis TaxID=2565783 RepID=A0A5B0E1F5_9HYPH|nr:homoserine kinase [Aureimonas fodinaquatilis]KAA0972486.1 homoserine kinase [Aureimonas fodinaquatilis]